MQSLRNQKTVTRDNWNVSYFTGYDLDGASGQILSRRHARYELEQAEPEKHDPESDSENRDAVAAKPGSNLNIQ